MTKLILPSRGGSTVDDLLDGELAAGRLWGDLELAVRVSHLAKDAVTHDDGMMRRVRDGRGRDLKIEADRALDRLIGEQLRAQSPYPVCSEERGMEGWAAGKHRYYWIVDPLDGSLNFSRGIPMTCISIALWRDLSPVAGVVLDINRDECFTGIVGYGAWLNQASITVGCVRDASRAVLCTGWPIRSNFSTTSLQDVVRQLQRYKKVRLLGSAALSLAYVACGRADVYAERRIALWDVAAGLAVLKAGGGVYCAATPAADHTTTVVAGNEVLVRQHGLGQGSSTRRERSARDG